MTRDDLLNKLFDTLLEDLIEKIKGGDAKPADLAVARQFLKDNHIEAGPENKEVQNLVDGLDEMPEFDQDSNIIPLQK